MDQKLALLVMLNNYFHDVATALLLASGLVVWVLHRKLDTDSGTDVRRYFLRTYSTMTRLAMFSLAWIIVGGIPRTIFYRDLEWTNAAGKGQVAALLVKHVLAFILVGAGACMWFKLSKTAKHMKSESGVCN